MNQSKFYRSCFDNSIPNDYQLGRWYSNLRYHTQRKQRSRISHKNTSIKCGISSSCAYVVNSMFVNGLSGILILKTCITRQLNDEWLNALSLFIKGFAAFQLD